jgi:hypothetical protein
MACLGIRDVRRLNLQPNEPAFHTLSRFVKGLRINVRSNSKKRRTRVIRELVPCGGDYQFSKDHNGGEMISVAVSLVYVDFRKA